ERTDAAVRPLDRPGRYAVPAYFGAELACERAREHHEPGLRGGIDGVSRQRALRVDVHQVQDQPARFAQRERRGLRKEERRFQVRADQVVPLFGRDSTERRRVKRGRVRSEEHTSELQSRENLVCRLLLEKKKLTAERTASRAR